MARMRAYWLAVAVLGAAAAGPAQAQIALDEVNTWAYQRANVSPETVGQSPFDLVAVDGVLEPLSQDTTATVLDEQAIATMRQRAGGPDRLVLARLDLGHARDTRYYWKPAWTAEPPDWLGEPDPAVAGRHFVKYWRSGWQNKILRGGDAYLSRLLKLGVDGVYLDGTTVHGRFGARASALQDMVDLVKAVRGAGRTVAGDFLVVAKAGPKLLQERAFTTTVDGVVAESMFLGQYGDKVQLNPERDVARMQTRLSHVLARDKPVFNLEYPSTAQMALYVVRSARELGYVPYATVPGATRLVIDYNSDLRLQRQYGAQAAKRRPRGDLPQAGEGASWPPENKGGGNGGNGGGGNGQGGGQQGGGGG